MPRHNLYKIQPLVQSLCIKHGAKYVSKPLVKGFTDILLYVYLKINSCFFFFNNKIELLFFSSLKKSGEMWREAYEELLSAM